MPRAAARKRRSVRNRKGRGGAAGKVRRARRPAQRRKLSRPRRRRAMPRMTRQTAGTGGGFYHDIARTMFPHEGELPCRYPDGQMLRTVAMNIVTTGTAPSAGVGVWDNVNNIGPNNTKAMIFTPGSVHCPMWFNPTPRTLPANQGIRPTAWETTGIGSPTYSSLYLADGSIGGNIEFSKYRVTGATLKVTYVGNADDSAGEITVQKFNPRVDVWNSIATTYTTDDEPCIPVRADQQSFDMRVERLPSRLGCYLSFGKSNQQVFSQFKDLEAVAYGTAAFIVAESPAVASLEACVIYFSGTKPHDGNTGAVLESKGQWRFELIQTVELIPKTASLLNKITTQAPPAVPIFHQSYDNLHKMIAEKNLDIVPSSRALDLRNLALSGSYSAASRAATNLGHGVPGNSVDPVGKFNLF